ncbi:putative malate dehydrogenase 1B isoform X1 [Amblyraja radiata]|uniref:putative malate dehydrogenase 1B isoform X1 n=2 Tax=Amblyraja radiata TaxID=386614 RepID=UPI001403CC7D|nr:putative malate dehydrogenase 1B isoform X1 [Amblyraja radiata]
MAKFVVAGRTNCPYCAKCEMVADYLAQSLPDFNVHKIGIHPENWQSWLQTICTANNWEHEHSPIIWRELVDRGGKGSLLGGFNEFMEYVQGYYGYFSDMQTDIMIKIAKENFCTSINEQQDEMSMRKNQMKQMSIWISGALNTACSILIPILISGEIFGENQLINLNLLDNEGSMSLLNGLQMEVEDMACPLLYKVSVHNSLRKPFMDADIIIILDDIAPDENQPIEDSYKSIINLYQNIGVRIDTFAKSGVRVIVAGDHVLNLKIHNLLQGAISIDRNNIIALSTQLEGETKALLARKLKVNTQDVKSVIVWGNIGRTTYIDLHRARVHRYENAVWCPADFSHSVMEVINDSEWIETEFQEAVHSHRTTLQQMAIRPIGLSLANAIYKVLQYWYFDSPPGEILSLGVISKGEFNIPAGLIFSMPVRFCGGKWVIQTDIEISKKTQRKLQYIVQELKMEESIDFSPITEMDMGNSLSSVAEHLPESIGEIVQEEDNAKEE